MKIEYKFVDGTVAEIEVDGSLGEFMLELKNEGDRVERKETRRHVLLSAVDPEDRYFDSGRDTARELVGRTSLRGSLRQSAGCSRSRGSFCAASTGTGRNRKTSLPRTGCRNVPSQAG